MHRLRPQVAAITLSPPASHPNLPIRTYAPPRLLLPSDATTIGRQERRDPRQTPTARPLRRGPEVAQAEGLGGRPEEGRLGSIVRAKRQQRR